jgi:hypothetical protein
MKTTFKDFLDENQICSKFEGNFDAKAIFDLLSEDENIIKMIDASEAAPRVPALTACAKLVEGYVDGRKEPQVDLNDNFTRTAVGRMVKTILRPFGYEVLARSAQRNFPKSLGVKYFTSASCYEKTGPATMKVVRKIEKI